MEEKSAATSRPSPRPSPGVPGEGEGKRPIVELLTLAAPTIGQMLSYTGMQFIDTLMLGHFGTLDATAGGNAGLLAYCVISLGLGVLMVVNTLVSQNFGAARPGECGKYLWQGLWFALFFYLLVLPLIAAAPLIFHAWRHEAHLAALESTYLCIVILFCLVKLVSMTLGLFLLGINRAVPAFIACVCGVAVNAVAAWALIFGHAGTRPLGVVGSAWAQNIGCCAELAVLLWVVSRPRVRGEFNVADARLRLREFWDVIRVGFGSGLQSLADILAWTFFVEWIMARFGTDAMAANTFVFRYMAVSFMPAVGISVATTALVGRYIGAGDPRTAVRRAHLGFAVTAAYMAACGLAFFLFRRQLIGLFTADPSVLRIGVTIMIFAAVYQVFDAMYIIYNGALRGAGDTFVPALATFGLCWGVTVGGGYAIARLRPDLGPAGPWIAALSYGIVLGFFAFARFARGRWRRIRLLQTPVPSATVTR